MPEVDPEEVLAIMIVPGGVSGVVEEICESESISDVVQFTFQFSQGLPGIVTGLWGFRVSSLMSLGCLSMSVLLHPIIFKWSYIYIFIHRLELGEMPTIIRLVNP